MTDFAFFLGCGIPSNENNYELATRRVLERVGVNLVHMRGAGCCGHDLEQIDRPTFLAWAARNLSIAEGMNSDIMVLCPSCYLTLKSVNTGLKDNKEEKDMVNDMLAKIGVSFQGSISVMHYVDHLLRDDVIPRLRETFVRSLKGLRVGVHYGCHLLRPARVLEFDDPIVPSKIDRLVDMTGARSENYLDKIMCCGMPILGTDMKASFKIASSKLTNVRNAGLHAIVTACPVCHMMFDGNQSMINKILSENHHIPVLHLTQLLGLAEGLSFEDLGLHKNKEDGNGLHEIIG